jgi:hypothetical protein
VDIVPEEIGRKSHYKLDPAAPIAKVEDLADYEAIIVGAGTGGEGCLRARRSSGPRGSEQRCAKRRIYPGFLPHMVQFARPRFSPPASEPGPG